MKDNSTLLQTSFINLIEGNITYSGDTVPIYDNIPDNPSYPYIQMGNKESNDNSNKTNFSTNDTVSQSIIDRFPNNTGSRKAINSVANDLFNLVQPNKGEIGLSIAGFKIIRCIVGNDIFLRELTPTYLYLRREIRWDLLIEQTS